MQASAPVLLGRQHLRQQLKDGVCCASSDCAVVQRCPVSLGDLQDAVDFSPEIFGALELGRLSLASHAFEKAVQRACGRLLRSRGFRFRDDSTGLRAFLTQEEGRTVQNKARALYTLGLQQADMLKRWDAAENYTLGINDDGALIVWGSPGFVHRHEPMRMESPDAALPSTAAPEQKPVRLEVFPDDGKRFIGVAGSRHAVFVLTDAGELMYVFMQRSSATSDAGIKLFRVKELVGVHIVDLSTRFGQAFAVAADGSVYGWGMRSGDRLRPHLACSMGFGEIRTLLSPTRLPSFGASGLLRTSVRSVVTGACHTLFIDDAGGVYAVGHTKSGKLGLGISVMQTEQVMLPEKLGLRDFVVGAAAGAEHTLLLSADGIVFGCGDARSGALASMQSQHHSVFTPKRLKNCPQRCVSVAAGIALSFFVCESGTVHFCGRSPAVSTPFGRSESVHPARPQIIPGLNGIRNVSVSMELSLKCREHAIFQSKSGQIFAWGHTGCGEFYPGCHELKDMSERKQSSHEFCNSIVALEK